MSGVAPRARALRLLSAALLTLLVSPSFGQSPEPPLFRRIFVPEEALNSHIRGLLPLKREEFERRVALAAKENDPNRAKMAARIERAVFRARLEGSELIQGEAEIAVVAATHEPVLLSLEPCGVELESAAWQTNRAPAVIGRNPAGQLQCLVEESGTLRLRWKQPAAEVMAGTSRFDLRLPAAPLRRLEITAAKEIALEVDGGLILDREVRPAGAEERIWPIELGGTAEIRLHARKSDASRAGSGLFIVREETQYNVLPTVIDLEASFTLDVLRQPLHELKLDVDGSLEITAVRMGDQRLPFSSIAAQRDGPQSVTVELPAELAGTDRVVAVDATAHWSSERAIELPRVKVAGGVLQEGRLEVHAPSWLRLQARSKGGCVQIDAAPASATRTTDRYVFQAFADDAAVEIEPDPTLAPLREESGTQLNIEATQVTGVLVAELKATGGGARFSVSVEMPHQWMVDGVETQPPEMLADRSIVSGGQNPHRLQLKLARPLTAQRPLRLIIRGHFRRPPNEQALGDEFFHLARFPEVHDRRQLVAVRVNDPAAELRLSGSEGVPRLDPTGLPPTDGRLFETPPGTLLLETGSLGQSLHATLAATTARYRADALVRAQIAHGRIEQTVTIHCQPETSNVASIAVRVAPRPRGDVTWRMAGDEGREIPALAEDSPSTGANAEGAVYRLLLPRPYGAPFDIVGQWSSTQSGSDALSLVFLPAAIRQMGLIEVAAPDRDVLVRSQELQAVPTLDDEQSTALYGRYRYEAGQRSKLSVEPLPSGVNRERAWIDSLQITSHYSTDGSAEHEAKIEIQNAGSRELPMHLPASASGCRLVMDSEAEEPLEQAGADNVVLIPLSPDQRDITVRVRYVSKDSTLGVWPMGTVRAPVPRFDLPVLAQSWHVMLPPDLAAASPSKEAAHPHLPDVGLHETRATAVPADSLRERLKSVVRVLGGPDLGRRWMTADQKSGSAGDPSFAGWNEHVLPLPASDEATLSVYRPRVLTVWSYCLALGAGAAVFWLRSRSGWLLLLAGLLAAVGVLNQAPTAWLLGGASVGIIVGQLLVLARPAPKPNRSVPPQQPATTTRHFAIEPAAGIFVFLAVVCAARLVAAPPDEKSSVLHDRPRVVIPVDNLQRPTGEYVFLEESLYERLHRFSQEEASGLPNVLIERALYELPAGPTARAGGAAIDELRATFDLHTFHPDATLQLPLRRDQALLLEGRARLDGEPVTLSWNADGRGLSLTIAQPGKHRLQLALAAAMHSANDAVALDIDVPPAAIAQVTLPASGASAGTVILNGATGKLHVRWPMPDAAEHIATALEADQLLWWKVRPGSVSLEGRFRVQPVGGPVRELVFEVDPRLRLLPGRTSGPIGAVKMAEDLTELMSVELTEPISAPMELRFAWLWPDASGVGTLMLPRVKLRADRHRTNRQAHDWTAISTEPGLKLSRVNETSSQPRATEAAPAEIAQVWPDVNLGDRPIVLTTPDAQACAVVVKPVVAAPHAEQRTEWSVSTALAQATYTARLTGVPLSRYEHRVGVPANVKVSRVSLMQAGRSIPVRWKQETKGLVIVSLLEPPAADETLTLSADCPLPRGQAGAALPAFALESVVDDGCTIRIYRQSDVRLKVEGASGWLPIDQEQIDEYTAGLGRLTAALRRQNATSAPPRVSRTTNQPRITGTIFTRASEDDGDWRGEVHFKLTVSGGVLDELRLSVPDEWSQPLEVEPAMEQRLEASQSEARRQLVLRPRRSLSGPVEITLRAPIHAGAGGLQAPDVFLVGNPLPRFVLLDRGSVVEEIDWEMTGLLAVDANALADLPPTWRGAIGDWFRVVGQRFDAIAKSRPARAATPRVALADIRCSPRAGRRIAVVASLTIQPRGARDAEFILPTGSRLVQALIDDLPALCISQGLRSWKIPVVSETLPYRLTIVYDTYVPAPTEGGAAPQLAAPALPGMEVQESLWTIDNDRAPRNLDGGDRLRFATSDPKKECTLAAAELARLETLAHLLDSVASAQTVELPRRILADSFLRWKHELTAIQHRLNALQDQKQVAPEMAAPMQLALDAAARSEQRLLQAGVLSESEVGETTRARHRVEPASATYYLAKGAPGELTISWTPSQQPLLLSRGAIAAAVAVAAILVALVFQLASVRDFIASRPHWALATLGVAWWLLAPLGWIGWLAVFAAVWCAFRPTAPGSSYESASSIVRWTSSRTAGSQSR